MEGIDAIRINFRPEQLMILNICLGFLMFGVALDLKLSHFRYLWHRPRASLLGLLSQWIVLPALTLLLIFIFRPPVSMALGMLLVAACPGGNVSNYAVHLAGANAALSILLTTISTLAAIAMTPLYFGQLAPLIPGAAAFQQDIALDAGHMVITILQLIVLPLLAGMSLNAKWPNLTQKLRKPVKLLSVAIFLGFIAVALYGNYSNLKKYLHLVVYIVFAHNAVALLSGYWLARSGGLPKNDARAISLETGIQNSGLGLILIFNFFNGLGGMAIVAAWWGIWHLISAFSLAMWWRNRPLLSSEMTKSTDFQV